MNLTQISEIRICRGCIDYNFIPLKYDDTFQCFDINAFCIIIQGILDGIVLLSKYDTKV